jgi:poly(3-hydroxybutyrate) depolymerase
MTGTACVAGSLILLANGLCRAELGLGDHNFGLKYRERGYIAHVPSARPAVDWPLVINLHGGGGHAKAQQRYSHMDAVADREGFLAIYPNGTEVVLWKLAGAGHVWPGGDIDYLTWALGPGTDVIDANTQMWRFFSRFRLDQ